MSLQVNPVKPRGQEQVKARPWLVQLPPLRQGLGRQLSELTSQKSPENPRGHRQEEEASDPLTSVHVPPFRQGELKDKAAQCEYAVRTIMMTVLLHRIYNAGHRVRKQRFNGFILSKDSIQKDY